jgi:hypothetical protein
VVVAFGLSLGAAIGLLRPTDHVPLGAVQIASAVQVVNGKAGSAARATEQVTYEDKNLELLGTYVVTDGALPGDDTVPTAARAVWEVTAELLPREQLAEIRQLNIVTDDANGTLAMVHRSTVSTNGWILSIDTAESNAVLQSTLVHELAHMLTLRRDDLAATASTVTCRGVRIEIGCARNGSALADWAKAFWGDGVEPARYEADRFVTRYAATSVHEDLAESFLVYVLGGDGKASAEAVRKLAFFDSRPEFVTARAEIRANLHLA